MVNITLSVNDAVYERMKNCPEINFSEVARQAIERYLDNKSIVSMTEKEREELYNYVLSLNKVLKKEGLASKNGKSKLGADFSWSINSAVGLLREGRFLDAAYIFEGIRRGYTYYEDERTAFYKSLHTALSAIVDYCLAFADPSWSEHAERFFYSNAKNLLFYKKTVNYFPSDPDEKNYLRFYNKKYFVNCLLLIFGLAYANELPTMSRAEIDPFGTNLTFKNSNWIMAIAKKFIEEKETISEADKVNTTKLLGIHPISARELRL